MGTKNTPKILASADLVHLNHGQRVQLLGGESSWWSRRVFLQALLGQAALFVAPLGCGKGGGGSDSGGPDGGGPGVCPIGLITAEPPKGATLSTSTGTDIRVIFDRPMNLERVKAAMTIVPEPEGGYVVNAQQIDGPYCLVWATCPNPTTDIYHVVLRPKTLYTVKVAGTATSLQGECFGGIEYSFTTGELSCACQSNASCPSNSCPSNSCSCQKNTCGCQSYSCGCQSHSGCSWEGCPLYHV